MVQNTQAPEVPGEFQMRLLADVVGCGGCYWLHGDAVITVPMAEGAKESGAEERQEEATHKGENRTTGPEACCATSE